jgi:dienelactone hydrolase
VTAIYRPTRKGRFPVIVFSHGVSGHPEKFTKLFAAWASAGYVIAAPAFPRTNSHVAVDLGDLPNQTGDVSFVLDRVLDLATNRESRLFRAIKRRRVGAAGLSLGGITTYNVVYSDCCRDARITAAIVLDTVRPGVVVDGHVPFLIAHSDTDPLLPYAGARQAFEEAEPPVWLHTFFGASHASQWEDDVTPYDQIAEQVTLDFWDATLKKKRPPRGLDEGLVPGGVAGPRHGAGRGEHQARSHRERENQRTRRHSTAPDHISRTNGSTTGRRSSRRK